ncbi:polyprenyl synthetase [Coraliomargarita sinensis]|uniref:Polyprenyl synthetase n=1 Tax=Coraliomargarita sinensis TaxID=2174842 RepID=A0A317ZGF6_9BACT|nr:farnesyl diphosphate synthase [Coraliomargarita sinensis]PXA03972.1 polyprenyl synthetase [Coraliomargarita sinensis]
MNEALKEKLQELRNCVETGIDTLIPPAATRPTRLHQAMRYSMEAGGKRIRPALLILASELFPTGHNPLAAAVAVECLHTYTLIHDDLPAVDNSDLRRGRPACHKEFDEATAILAGDALLTYAFQLLAHTYDDCPKLATALIGDLATASGSQHLIGGQMEDIENEGKAVEAGTLHYIHENKTAALLTAALLMGLRFSDPGQDKVEAMRLVGTHLGLAFQIIDDILDATSDAETMGKPVGNDASANKSTYVALHGIEGARAEAGRHTAAAIEAARKLGGENEILIALIQDLGERIN